MSNVSERRPVIRAKVFRSQELRRENVTQPLIARVFGCILNEVQ